MSVESVCLLSLDYRGVYCRGIFCSSFSFRILFYSSTSEIFSNATETNEEKFLSFFCWGKFLLVYNPCMEEVVATGPGRRVYTWVLGRSSGRQPPAAVHSIHPLRRPPYIHPLCPWGSFLSHCSAPRFKPELTLFVLLGEDWGSTDLPQRKKQQQLGSNTTTTKDNGMEEEEASEVRNWSNSKYKNTFGNLKVVAPRFE